MESIETRKDRFKRLAEPRTNEVLKKLDILGNCSNKHNYYYTPEDIQNIFFAIEKKLHEVRGKFKTLEEEENSSFKL